MKFTSCWLETTTGWVQKISSAALQICNVPTRKGATLQLIITDLHTFMYPPTAEPPMQKDEGSKGMDGDHQTLMFAPKASKDFFC